MGGVASPIYVALGSGLVDKVPGGAHPLGDAGEHLAKRLVGVRQPPLSRSLLAVLDPEELDRELAVPLLALDQRLHVRLQVGAVRPAPLPREEQVIDDVGVHGADGVERQAVLAQHPRAGRHVSLADVQCGGDAGLADPSLREQHEDPLVLRHRHQAPFHGSAPRIRRASWNSRFDAGGTKRPYLQYQAC